MERVSALRHNLCNHHLNHNDTQKLKDILFLDLCLEQYLRQLTERIMHIDIGFEGYVREVSIILSNLALSYSWNELGYLRDDWNLLVRTLCQDMHTQNARKIKSVIDRVKQALGETNDSYVSVL